ARGPGERPSVPLVPGEFPPTAHVHPSTPRTRWILRRPCSRRGRYREAIGGLIDRSAAISHVSGQLRTTTRTGAYNNRLETRTSKRRPVRGGAGPGTDECGRHRLRAARLFAPTSSRVAAPGGGLRPAGRRLAASLFHRAQRAHHPR